MMVTVTGSDGIMYENKPTGCSCPYVGHFTGKHPSTYSSHFNDNVESLFTEITFADS